MIDLDTLKQTSVDLGSPAPSQIIDGGDQLYILHRFTNPGFRPDSEYRWVSRYHPASGTVEALRSRHRDQDHRDQGPDPLRPRRLRGSGVGVPPDLRPAGDDPAQRGRDPPGRPDPGTITSARSFFPDPPATLLIMDLTLPELPFPLRGHGPDGQWSYADGVLTGRAGARQDRLCRRPATTSCRRRTLPAARPARRGLPADRPGLGRVRRPVRCRRAVRPRRRPGLGQVLPRGVSRRADGLHRRHPRSLRRRQFLRDRRRTRTGIGSAGSVAPSPSTPPRTGSGGPSSGTSRSARRPEPGPPRSASWPSRPEGEGCRVSFDRLAFRADGPEDLRDGS